MCGPWAIPLAIMAAGSVAKYAGEKQATNARNDAFNSEHARQAALTSQQTADFQDSLHKVGDVTDSGAQTKAVAAREGTLASAIAPVPDAGSYLPGSSSAPSIVSTAADKASAHSSAVGATLAHTLATLGGATDQQQGLDTAIGRNSQQIGQLSSFKAGSAGVLDAEMRAAAQKGTFLRGAGDLAQQIGGAWLGAKGGFGGGAGKAIDGGSAFRVDPSLGGIY